jgi:hypothetical protein
LGPTESVLPEDGDRIQSPKRVLKNKEDYVLDKGKSMDNVQKHNIYIAVEYIKYLTVRHHEIVTYIVTSTVGSQLYSIFNVQWELNYHTGDLNWDIKNFQFFVINILYNFFFFNFFVEYSEVMGTGIVSLHWGWPLFFSQRV